MLGLCAKKRLISDEEFVQKAALQARHEFIKYVHDEWPKRVNFLGIPYNKYQFDRLIENFELLKEAAAKLNLRVEIKESHIDERYLFYSYLYLEVI